MAKVIGDTKKWNTFANVKPGEVFTSIDTGRVYICSVIAGASSSRRGTNLENGEIYNLTDGTRVLVHPKAVVNVNG